SKSTCPSSTSLASITKPHRQPSSNWPAPRAPADSSLTRRLAALTLGSAAGFRALPRSTCRRLARLWFHAHFRAVGRPTDAGIALGARRQVVRSRVLGWWLGLRPGGHTARRQA